MDQRLSWSGQQDLNLRPGVPKPITDWHSLAKGCHKALWTLQIPVVFWPALGYRCQHIDLPLPCPKRRCHRLMTRLSKTTIANLHLPRGRSDVTHFDSDIGGFGIRIRKSGARSWVYQYDNAIGRTRRITIGSVSAIDAAKARTIASQLHARVRLGEDVAAAKAEKQARNAETFGAVLPLYMAWHRMRVRPATLRHTERHLVHNLSALHSLPIGQIDRRAISTQLQRMASSPVQANRTRSSLSAFLNWALREGLVDSNAALATNKNVERSRDRVLTNAELRAVWLALPKGDFGDIMKILILTGAREREISDLHWAEINLDKGVIELPAHRVKNRRKHVIPMSGAVRAILESREQNGSDFVFGAS